MESCYFISLRSQSHCTCPKAVFLIHLKPSQLSQPIFIEGVRVGNTAGKRKDYQDDKKNGYSPKAAYNLEGKIKVTKKTIK